MNRETRTDNSGSCANMVELLHTFPADRSQRDGLQQRGKEEGLEKYGDGPPSKREH